MIDSVEILASGHIALKGYHTKPDGDENVGLDAILVIMAHSYPGNQSAQQGLFSNIANTLKTKGFHSLRFDFRGCGESDGDPEDFTLSYANKDFQAALSWAKDKGYQRFVYIGEGLGASICLANLDAEMACLVLLWPVLDFQYLAKIVFNADHIEEQWKKAGYMIHGDQRVSVQFIEEMRKADLMPALQRTDAPILVMHGGDDKVAPIDRLDLIRAHARSKRIDITSFQNGTHGLPDEEHRAMLMYHLTQFIQKYP